MTDCEPLSACRSCGAERLTTILDLGSVPLANRLLDAADLAAPEPVFPLRLVGCARCSLLQIDQTMRPDVLFRDYPYFSSVSPALLRHAEQHAARLIERLGLGTNSLVIEAASNDGYLLRNFLGRGIPVLGVEPARNIAAVARERGIPTVTEFFGAALAGQLREEEKRAELFLANNVLAHVADLNGFVRGIETVLAPDGRAVLEVPYARDMIEHGEFDTIYHEHLCYFSLTALVSLFRRHGLEVVEVERVAIHGGSLRITAAHAGVTRAKDSVADLLAEERGWGVHWPESFGGFRHRVEETRRALLGLLAGLKRGGKRIAAYGASAKGSTLLNHFGIGRETLEFVADRSPRKQGRFTPGTRLPIVAPERLTESAPDYVLLLTWNFAAEILEQQVEYRRRGGKFIIPIPTVTVI